jgi:putative acetyltransferase
MNFVIRLATTEDVEQIADAHVDSIWSLGGKAYTREVMADWGAARTGERYRNAMIEGHETYFVAVYRDNADQEVLGFSSYRVLDGKHRVAVYVRGNVARSGIGTALLQAAEGIARKKGGYDIYVDASLVATEFYEVNGFEVLGVGKHVLQSGQEMACVRMKKQLTKSTIL